MSINQAPPTRLAKRNSAAVDPTRPADSTSPTTALAIPPTDTCDLCQRDLNDGVSMQAHLELQHPSLLALKHNLADQLQLVGGGQPTAARSELLALGALALKFSLKADGGEAAFHQALEAQAQLQVLCRGAFPEAHVFLFGSCSTLGTHDGNNDLDFTLVDPKAWAEGNWPPKGDEAAVVKKLCRILRDAGFEFSDLEPVLRTRVPVLRRKHEEPPFDARKRAPSDVDTRTLRLHFGHARLVEDVKASIGQAVASRWEGATVRWSDQLALVRFNTATQAVEARQALLRKSSLPHAPVHVEWGSRVLRPAVFLYDFDISCRGHGVRNSLLLRAYMERSPLVRAGAIFIKKWSKCCGLNNSKNGFLTSYAVTLIWIYFCIQTGLATFVDTAAFPSRPDPDRRSVYLPTIPPGIIADATAKDTFTTQLGQAIVDFFHFYATFDWGRYVISVSQPGRLEKVELGWTPDKEQTVGKFRDRVHYKLCIEDPFEENLNLGRHASANKMLHIAGVFQNALVCIASGRSSALLAETVGESVENLACSALGRYMIGRRSAPVRDALSSLHRTEPFIMSCFQVAHQVDRLFQMVGLSRTGDTLAYEKDVHGFVEESSRDLYESVSVALRQAGPGGLPTPENAHTARLIAALLVHDPSADRLFDSTESRAIFRNHVAVALRLLDKEKSLAPDILMQKMEKRLGDNASLLAIRALANPSAADRDFSLVDGKIGRKHTSAREVREATNAPGTTALPRPNTGAGRAPAPAALPRPNAESAQRHSKRNYQQAGRGACFECKTQGVQVWPAKDQRFDVGLYCDQCWSKYDATA